MSRETLRIEIPIHRPDDFLKLCQKISNKHNADPGSSPIDAGLMALFDSRLSDAQTHRSTAKSEHNLGESQLGASKVTMGFAKHQNSKTDGTLNNILLKCRDTLDITNRQNPEDSSLWGFDVVVSDAGGRVTVRYNIPTNHDEFLDLADAIWDKHQTDGAGSPLNVLDMATFDSKRQAARTERNNGINAHNTAQAENGAADVLIGRAEHQNSRTEDTLYYDVLAIRDTLKIVHQQNPEAISEWGFNVVVGTAAVGRKAVAKVNLTVKGSEEGNPPIEGVLVFDQITGEEIGTTDADGKLRDENQVVGLARYEISAEGYQTQVVEIDTEKGENDLEVLMEVEVEV